MTQREQQRLTITPITSREANEFVKRHHRHHAPLAVGYVFSVAVADELGAIRGVAIVGRPCARHMVDGYSLEVRRVATDGCQNACSALYGAAWRTAKALGYRRLITYILESENGISLRAAGYKCIGTRGGGEWSRPSRIRGKSESTGMKTLFEVRA